MTTTGNNFIFRHQPLKALYLTYIAASLLFIRIPIWSILSVVPWLRPRSSWTYRRTLLVKSLQVIVPAIFNTASFGALRISPDAFMQDEDAAGLVWIDAAPELVVGEIKEFAKINKVSAVQVPAYWYGSRDTVTNRPGQRALPDEKVILNLHSGGWVVGDAAPTGLSAPVCNELLQRFPQFSRVLNVEYRLSQGPPFQIENPFPAALIDAVTAYSYLVNELLFNPRNILVMGDSAGGTLAFQLIRYVASGELPNLTIPGGALLLSPSMDWGESHMGARSSYQRNRSSDWVDAFMIGYCTVALLGRLPRSEANVNPWISAGSLTVAPIRGLYSGFPPTLFFGGGGEMTLDAMKVAAKRVAEDLGEDKVEFIEQRDATHIILGLPGHSREQEEGYQLIGDWINRHF